ncbi:transposase [Candidatus Vondammii sp. HM_W22]|uniref:transposase n=1 Tax=Candidatus Vondammii sp. HM_W22 TaxID=2687299 RepID=UPI001F13E241|nr:transposase [Candidatus Vondammii sp. HM_W22]
MKRGKKHYGYKKTIGIDRKHKVIHKYAITSAEVHDSQVFEERLDENNSNGSVWADSAYRSVEREQEANRKRSRVRARVEHVFAQQANRLVRSIGQVRLT